MWKANELINKTVVHHTTGAKLATVYNLVFDNEIRNVAALMIDSGGWFRDARVIPWNRVVSISDVVLVQGDFPIVKASDAEMAHLVQQEIRLTGTPIVSDTGERMGTVGDLFINERGEIAGYEVKQSFMSLGGRKFLPADAVQAVGKDAIISTTTDLPSVKDAQAGRTTTETKAE